MSSAWPLITAALLMGAGGSLHCVAMCSGLQRMTLRGIPIVTRRAEPASASSPAASTHAPLSAESSSTAGSHAAGSGATSTTTPDTATAPAASRPATRSPDPTPSFPRLLLPDGRWWRFQAGRIMGYGLLGATAGLIGQEVLGAAQWQPAFESIWAGLNAVLVMLGLSLLILGREPVWLSAAGSRLAGLARLTPGRGTEWLRGMLWALLPCGLLYTALSTAILAATPLSAAIVMAAFALGTNLGLLLMESGLHNLLAGRRPELAYRFNGVILVALAGAGLVAALTGHSHPFC